MNGQRSVWGPACTPQNNLMTTLAQPLLPLGWYWQLMPSPFTAHCCRVGRENGVPLMAFALASCCSKGKITIVLLVHHIVFLKQCHF